MARSIFQQVVVALDYCHRLGVVNRDVKLENCLIWKTSPNLHIKLTDFGYSKSLVDSAPKSLVGTPGYTGTTKWLAVCACLTEITIFMSNLNSRNPLSFCWHRSPAPGKVGCLL